MEGAAGAILQYVGHVAFIAGARAPAPRQLLPPNLAFHRSHMPCAAQAWLHAEGQPHRVSIWGPPGVSESRRRCFRGGAPKTLAEDGLAELGFRREPVPPVSAPAKRRAAALVDSERVVLPLAPHMGAVSCSCSRPLSLPVGWSRGREVDAGVRPRRFNVWLADCSLAPTPARRTRAYDAVFRHPLSAIFIVSNRHFVEHYCHVPPGIADGPLVRALGSCEVERFATPQILYGQIVRLP